MSPHHLIIGGQRSGKSRHAERLAQAWLRRDPLHRVTVLATAMAADDEMRQRVARHREDRPAGFEVVEAPLDLAGALRAVGEPKRMVVIDCLTLWVTNVWMPMDEPVDEPMNGPMHRWPKASADTADTAETAGLLLSIWAKHKQSLLAALREREGPVVLVSNEIGMGVIPLGAEVRCVVDELGRLHQDVAQCCGHITLMVAGQPFTQVVQRWD